MKISVINTICILSMSISISFGQKNTANISATYSVVVKKDGKIALTDDCKLFISQDKSLFVSLNREKGLRMLQMKYEKAMQNGGQINFDAAESQKLTNFLPFTVIKEYKKNVAVFVENVNGQSFGYIKDSTLQHNWILKKDTLTIAGLKCHKAYYTNQSLIVTAWYCTEVPVSEGPFTYKGLPGLIVKFENNKGWEAELTSLQYDTKEKPEQPVYTLTTEEKVIKMKNEAQSRLLGGELSGSEGTIKMSPQKD